MVKYFYFARTAAHLIASLFFLTFNAIAGSIESVSSIAATNNNNYPFTEAQQAATPIFVQIIPPTIQAGKPFWVEVRVGTENAPVDSLFGLSFELNYSFPQYITVLMPDSANLLPGTLLGSDVVFLAVPDSVNGAVSVGISRKAGSENVNGFGTVFRARLMASAEIPDSTEISFSFSRLRAQDKDGNPVLLVPLEESAIVFQPENFTLNVSPTADTVAIGQRANYRLSLSPVGGFNKSVLLTLRPVKPGISSTFSQPQISPTEDVTLTLLTDSTVTPGLYAFEAVATADTFFRTIVCSLNVVSVPIFPTTVSSEYFSNTPFQLEVQIGVSDKPVMNLRRVEFSLNYTQSAYLSPLLSDTSAPVHGELLGENASIVFEARPDSGKMKLIVESAAANGVSGYGSVVSIPFKSDLGTPDATQVAFTIDRVVATDADGMRIFLSTESHTLTIREKLSISLEVEPDTLTIAAGEIAQYLVRAKGSTSFNGTVMLSSTGEPQNAKAGFLPAAIGKNQTAVFSVDTDTSTIAALYSLTIRGVSGGLFTEKQATLIVTPAPAFTLSITPDRHPVLPGDTALYTISINEAEHLQSPVLLNLPGTDIYPWLNFSILPAEIDATTEAHLTLFVRDDAPTGNFNFQLIGKSSTATRAIRVGLDILEPPPPVRPIPFTPNNDGFNDFVLFEFDELKTQSGNIVIFDLHGRKVVELRGVMKWDGKDENGKFAQPGAYLYVVRVGNKILKKGVLALAR